MGYTFQFAWEVSLIEFLQKSMPSLFMAFLKIVSVLGDTLPVVGVLAFVYLCYDKKAGRLALFNTISSLMFATILKNIFKRRRPYFDNKGIKCLKAVEKEYDIYDISKQGFSFPSMHSSNILTVTGTIYYCFRKYFLLVLCVLLSAIIGISRFSLGCHYPSDVLAGFAIGLFSIFVVTKLQEKLEEYKLYLLYFALMIIGSLFCSTDDFFTTCGIFIGYIASVYVDKKYVNFKNTRNIFRMIMRLVLAGVCFLSISALIELPFSVETLEANNYFAYALRVIRYALSAFVAMGISPMVYKYNILKVKEDIE